MDKLLNILWKPRWEGSSGRMDTCTCTAESLSCSLKLSQHCYLALSQYNRKRKAKNNKHTKNRFQIIIHPFFPKSPLPMFPEVKVAQSCLTLHTHQICQTPLSMELSRQEYLSGYPFSTPGELPDTGIEPGSPALRADVFYHMSQKGSPRNVLCIS